jgi:hypothetical protein
MIHKTKVTVCSEIHTKTHKFIVISMHYFAMLILVVRKLTVRF